MSFCLASASPRRRAILETLGLEFVVAVSEIDERLEPTERAEDAARRLARQKALDVARREKGNVFLGADTLVVRGQRIFGKPADDEDAKAMLSALSAGWHRVVTGVALVNEETVIEEAVVATRIRFVALTPERIERYVATGEGADKAGAYAVQGRAAAFVERIEGSYSNVVGLPAAVTLAMLERHGAIGAWP